ncbi:MAG: DUF3516 domain-containing protein [Myxococcota bacterium]
MSPSLTLPANPDPDSLLEAFLEYTSEKGLELYPAQEEALLEIFAGKHVILNTPTGSGKSLVALAAHFRALALGQRSFYTAPIKALVSEKFFDLCRDLGADNVGMMTGDASVNRDAPVICCTAEILANLALRDGPAADVDHVVMDEFHYYSDRDRGSAWQIPILILPKATFLLMSATMGRTEFFQKELEERTGHPAALVKSTERPVPLDFVYKEIPLHETIGELLEANQIPVYIVHFTQRSATEQAQNLMSVDFLSKDQKAAIKSEIGGFRFDTPFGKELRRYVQHGVGVHHAGLLPKYRRLVERLAQKGHLKLICGTDTLGVGVNIPIRTVLFTKLCKYDGEKTRILTVRDFQQIAGRAGRKGYDDRGSVVAQAPEHVIENRAMESKAGGDAKKLRKLVRKKAPERGYAHWDEGTYRKLIESDPEPLRSSFTVTHGTLLLLLDRPGDGCRAVRELVGRSHESHVMKRRIARRAVAMFRSLLEAGVVEMDREPDSRGRKVRVNLDLQEDFSLNQSLGLWVIDTIEKLDKESPEHALDVLTLVEAVQENPTVVLLRQLDKLKTDTINELKAEGVEYEERMEILEKLEWPKPLRDFIYESYNAFAEQHPWVGENIRPKSVARDMYERAAGFNEYVKEYGLSRSEGVLLRYLSDVYKATVQTVPEDLKNDELYDVTDWLGAVVRQVDSSLLDEWEKLRNPEEAPTALPEEPKEVDITSDKRAFTVLIRNAAFRFVQALSRGHYGRALSALHEPRDLSESQLEVAAAPFVAAHGPPRTDPRARAPVHTRILPTEEGWTVEQVLVDDEESLDWFVRFELRRSEAKEAQAPTLRFVGILEGAD